MNHIKYTSFYLCFLLCTPVCLAQYRGGTGDGTTNGLTHSFINGSEFSLYQGSSGDGSDVARSSFVNGQEVTLFYGGRGDGTDHAKMISYMVGQQVTLYNGGSGDGEDNKRNSVIMNGQVLALFNGGSGDGFDRSFLSLQFKELCDLVLEIHDQPILDGDYKASDQIFSSGAVDQNGTVNFISGNNILFEKGFNVSQNALFQAIISVCVPDPVSY